MNKQMKYSSILFLIPPGTGGVRDFSELLAKELSINISVKVVEWKKEESEKIIALFSKNDVVYIQYTAYGYDRLGIPIWLVNQLKKNMDHIRVLGVYFHELYYKSHPLSSTFWLNPVQKYLIKKLATLSDFWQTNREVYGKWIEQEVEYKPHNSTPVFSNVGELPFFEQNRDPIVVVFGSPAVRQKTYLMAGDNLFRWAKHHNLTIHDIGNPVDDLKISGKLRRNSVITHGHISSNEISRILSKTMFGILAYEAIDIGKSGVFAAYCSHGVSTILLSKPGNNDEGLTKYTHYYAEDLISLGNLPEHSIVGKNAWNWYSEHSLKKQASVIRDLVDKIN